MENERQLLERIEQLEDNVVSLQRTIRRMLATFMPNPQYPYWQKLLELGLSEEKKMELECVLSILTERLLKKNFIIKQDSEITDELIDKIVNQDSTSQNRIISQSTVNLLPDGLANNSLPDREESLSIISKVLEIPFPDARFLGSVKAATSDAKGAYLSTQPSYGKKITQPEADKTSPEYDVIISILRAMRKQSMFVQLITFLLDDE